MREESGRKGDEVGFRFDPESSKRRFSDGEILRGLRRYAKSRNRRGLISQREWGKWRAKPFSAATVSARFGTWHAGLVRAGLKGAKKHVWTPGELMDLLERVWVRVGKAPSNDALRKLGTSDWPFKRYWGSLPAARRRFAEWKEGRISREELLRPTVVRREWGRRALSAALRLRVLMRDGQRCVICGQGAREGSVLEVDHIVPVCRGGGDGMENLRTLCRACNRGKGKRAA